MKPLHRKKQSPMEEILNDPNKKISEPRGPRGALARLWRQILADHHVNPGMFNALMNDFITDARNGVPNNRLAQTSARGNFTKEFHRKRMTWAVFVKGLRFKKFRYVRFIVQGCDDKGVWSEHSTDMNFGNHENIEDVLQSEGDGDDDEETGQEE